ncbi:serine hydrolase domain-containing protein [Sphingomonas colocasiae]|uniref:Beta-lactamase family protein n=1 Tax=Sphingomonas colocasiae TaxID=1848973 RepID=A0ABS7PWM9_9SPHN|nr:serine hydrolase [Sphingomonas colocasiae]MBY8825696.1 beta-lactamase family protein [Sphingomonas colocasiae]
MTGVPIDRRDAVHMLAWLGAGLTASAMPGRSWARATDDMSRDAAKLLFLEGDAQIRAFRNMDRLFATRPIRRGGVTASLPRAPTEPELVFSHDGRDWTLAQFMAFNRVASLVAVHKGRIVLERYALGNDAATRWTSFSMAKSVTSLLVGAAIADGHIGAVTDPVVRYLPALRGTAFDGTIIRDLLRMSSGIRWSENYLDPASDVNRLLGLSAARDRKGQFFAHLASLPRAYPPGTVHQYKTGESCMLGEVVAAAIGGPLSPYLSERIWQPMGMEADAYWVCNAEGDTEWGGGCISATARDVARLGLFCLNDGIAAGRRILPAGWMAESTQPSAPHKANGGVSDYGYQWWIQRTPASYRAEGVFGQLLHIDPAADLLLVLQSAWPRPSEAPRDALNAAFVGALAKVMA